METTITQNSSYRPLDYYSGSSQSHVSNQNAFHMPLLDDAAKRVRELGYSQNVPAGIQMLNNTPYGAACATDRMQSYIVPHDFQPSQGKIPANLPHPDPNPHPNPYNPVAVQELLRAFEPNHSRCASECFGTNET